MVSVMVLVLTIGAAAFAVAWTVVAIIFAIEMNIVYKYKDKIHFNQYRIGPVLVLSFIYTALIPLFAVWTLQRLAGKVANGLRLVSD